MNRNDERILKRKTAKRILRYFRRRMPLLLLSLFLAVASSLLMLPVPLFVGKAVDSMIGKGSVDFSLLTRSLLLIAASASAAAAFQWLMNVCNNRIAYFTVRDMREEVFAKLNEASVAYLDAHPHGDLVSRVIQDAEQFSDGILMGLTQFFSGAVTILGTLCVMFSIRWQIAVVLLLVTPLSLFAAKFISGRTYRFFQKQTAARGDTVAFEKEMLGGVKTIRAMGYEERAGERFDELNEKLRFATLKATFFSSLTNPVTRFVNSVAYASVAFSGAYIALHNPTFTAGMLSSFLSYANQYTKPFNEITGVLTELQGALACAARIFALLDLPPEAVEKDDECAEELPHPRGEVEFRDVFFSYTPDRPLISHFSLHVHPGMQIAIVGPTGCGKTTLMNLLLRFYDVTDGAILLDGKDIRKIKRKQLRAAYGMVLQDIWMRTGTVRENITMGRPGAGDEEMIGAAKAARAHRFIRRLPKGYDTVIGEGGAVLGEGQKQLLSIARVMLLDPAILVFDEATSSIDVRTELQVREAFAELLRGRTAFIVAHRLKTVQNADLILVMKDGQVIEQGTHTELLSKHGFYFSLYRSQFDRAEESLES